ncbi:MAG: hypothetical protein HRU19_30015 [Pseudobacteriovorax sp.]|nr:hypothetical protein [Pseudobacteriovorax sp.]
MNLNQLTNTDKVAIVLLALGEELASEIFRRMSQDEVKRVGAAMSRLGRINQEQVNIVMTEFKQLISATSSHISHANPDFLRSALVLAFRDSNKALDLADEISQSSYRFRCFEQSTPNSIGLVLAKESAQTIAVVLANIEPSQAVQTLKAIPEQKRIDAIARIADLDSVDVESLAIIDDQICQELSGRLLNRKRLGGADKAAQILSKMHVDGETILDSLQETHADQAAEIMDRMVRFEDILKMDPQPLRDLFQLIDRKTWHLALRGTNEALLQSLKTSMSERSYSALCEDIDALGPQPLKHVREAQNEIIKKAVQQYGIALNDQFSDRQVV